MTRSENGWSVRADNTPVFREVQRLHWTHYALTVLAVIGAITVPVAVISEGPGGGEGLPLYLWIVITTIIVASTLMFFMKLVTEVREDGLYVQAFPFHLRFRKIGLEDLDRFEAVTYQPTAEYSGWGRGSGDDKAYKARGNRGVRLCFRDGKKLLIGSQRVEELAEAIGRITSEAR